MLKIVKIHKF